MTDSMAAGIDDRRNPVTVVLMGVSGGGKSSVLAALMDEMDAAFAEGDEFHSEANIDRMRAGIPLTDADRAPWLQSIGLWIGAREEESIDAVVTCSALRRRYRDVLRDGHPSVLFVHLIVPQIVLEGRVATRKGHYMPLSLLQSQLETLEPLEADEPGFELVADGPPSAIAAAITTVLGVGGRRKGC